MNKYLVPMVSIGVAGLLVSGIGSTLLASDLSAANELDVAAAQADYAPATGLDVRAPLPPSGAVGGAGIIEPKERPASLASPAGGVVEGVAVAEGQRVAAGAVLVTLRAETVRADLAAARADLAAAHADRAAAAADAGAAEARAKASALAAERTAALFARGVATPDERDQTTQTREADAQAARAAQSRIRQATARIEAAAARVVQAEARLRDLEIRAPADGEVLQVLVLPGEYLAPGSAAAVLGDTSELRARLDIDERDAAGVSVGDPALIRIEGQSRAVSGKVVEVGRRVGRKNVRTDDPTDRLDARFVEVVVALDEPAAVPIGIRVDGSIGASGAPE